MICPDKAPLDINEVRGILDGHVDHLELATVNAIGAWRRRLAQHGLGILGAFLAGFVGFFGYRIAAAGEDERECQGKA